MIPADLESILEAVFQDEALARQPRYIVEVDPADGLRLRKVYAFIRGNTLRGRHIDSYPLKVVAVVSDQSKREIMQKELVGLPHLFVESISDLEKQGIDGSRLALFLDFSNDPALIPEAHHGIIRYGCESLLSYAERGYFPRIGFSFCYGDKALNHFEKRPYTVRTEGEGVFVLEKDGKSEGVLQFTRQNEVVKIESLVCKWEYEEEFLEFFLQQAFCTTGVTEVHAILSCENYPGKDVLSVELYVEELKHEKGSADLATKLHVKHGAEIIKCIPDYKPNDTKNLGYGVLVVYTKGSRVIQHAVKLQNVLSYEREFSPDSIRESVEKIIKGFNVHYDKDKTVEELGFDDLQQLELRKFLSDEFRIDFPSNVFMLYPTPARIIDHIIAVKLQPYKEWLYETVWESTRKPDYRPLTSQRPWLLISEKDESYTQSLKEFLHEMGQQLTDDLSCAGAVVYLKAINLKGELEEQHKAAIQPLVEIVNKMASLKSEFSPKLYVATESISIDGSEKCLVDWPLNALCKIIREEYPKFQCSVVSGTVEDLIDEIRGGLNEPTVAYRNGQRLVPKLVRSHLHTVRIPSFSPRASYLIAGGARTLGLLLARWYASHGAKHILLLDELELNAQAKATISELEKLGIDISYCKAPLDNEREVNLALDEKLAKMPPLQGVVHAAGVVDNDLLVHMNWDRFRSVHRLKVALGWILHKRTAKLKLDHFILFASALANFSPLGKANHATGNSFLDALSHYRQKQGLPSLTIDWGPWDLKSMEVRHLIESPHSDRVKMLALEEGLQIFDHLFYLAKPQIVAALVNWPVVLAGVSSPFFDEMAYELGYKKLDVLKKYYESSQTDQLIVLEEYLHERVRKLLQLPSAQLLEPNREFIKMGMDLHTLQTLQNLIQNDLGEIVKLPYGFVEAHSSLDKLKKSLKSLLERQIPNSARGELLSESLLNDLKAKLQKGGDLPRILILP
ncbi:MAG: SDR family NAD(P)-dependent oxidoreductase [Verrucomicrobia bacterium]|nr:SDR family NAD(P)-dependent oxidoreductase [Verrucomicrobiota bacterium]MBS0636912.1 SDR family NAD(P)-dependent oxidoreductase [Verrucomicrobiota bacterium]